jgi:hypothetical protein
MRQVLDSHQFGSCNVLIVTMLPSRKEIVSAYSLDLARDLDELERHLLACEFVSIFY